MKFIIQQYGNHWLVKTFLDNGDAPAVAKKDEAIRDVQPNLNAACEKVQELAEAHGYVQP